MGRHHFCSVLYKELGFIDFMPVVPVRSAYALSDSCHVTQMAYNVQVDRQDLFGSLPAYGPVHYPVLTYDGSPMALSTVRYPHRMCPYYPMHRPVLPYVVSGTDIHYLGTRPFLVSGTFMVPGGMAISGTDVAIVVPDGTAVSHASTLAARYR
eukprot:3834200-Rhodomonas_salina.3